jgi:hypothetical protein
MITGTDLTGLTTGGSLVGPLAPLGPPVVGNRTRVTAATVKHPHLCVAYYYWNFKLA